MRIKELENQLLKENKKALQFLHHVKGFDFEAPYFISRHVGSFTWNKVNKMIAENLGDKYTAALLIKSTSNRYTYNRLVYADMLHGGKFNALHDRDIPRWEYNMDDCCGVGDFENLRKNATHHYYIIAQRVDLLRWPEKKAVDLSQRFHMVNDKWNPTYCGDGRGNRYISRVKLHPTIGTGKPFEYQHQRGEEQTNELHNIIDKSGYLVCRVRSDLKRRALQLRYDRARAAAQVLDTSDREREIRIRIDTLKTAISRRVLSGITLKDVEAVSKAADKLRWAVFYFERYLERRKNNEYSSIESIESSFENIENYLNGAWKE